MTTPGGVPNLPVQALTLDTLASKLQDMSGTAMKARAVQQFPGIMDNSTGLSPASDVTPFGILARIWAEVMSGVANADPADITGPEDLPELFLEFIEGLPVVGQFVTLVEAILGNYDGDDQVMLAIQQIFAPIRAVVQLISGQGGSIPTVDEIVAGWESLMTSILAGPQSLIDAFVSGLTGTTSTGNDLTAIPLALINNALQLPAQLFNNFFGTIAALQAQVNGLQGQVSSGQTAALTDDFTIATVAGYTNIVGVLAVSTRGPYLQTPALAAAYRNTSAATEKHGAVYTITGKMRGTVRVAICSDNTMGTYAALEVYCGFSGDSVRLVTGTSPTVSAIRKFVDYPGGANLQNTNTFEIWYEPAINTFHLLLNGGEIMSWPDTGGDTTHGSSNRRVVVVTNADDNPDDGAWGPGIGKVTINDK